MTSKETAVRKRSAATTRAAIRHAARQRFARESYENVGLRDIAGDVGVDVAMVGRYFGSKEELFREVLRGGEKKFNIEAGAENLATGLASICELNDDELTREHAEGLLIILRSASSPSTARIVQEGIREDLLGPIAAVLDGDDKDARAAAALAILMGMTMLRVVMGVQPSCESDRQFWDRRLQKVIETALSEDA